MEVLADDHVAKAYDTSGDVDIITIFYDPAGSSAPDEYVEILRV